ncbi:MAG TPA: hypothetical protein VIL09_07665 [Microvirga sp.]|jgi:hypothetical protein
MSAMVTIRTADGATFGPYPIHLATIGETTPISEYEREALACAREDGLPEKDAAGCTYTVMFPKDEGAPL